MHFDLEGYFDLSTRFKGSQLRQLCKKLIRRTEMAVEKFEFQIHTYNRFIVHWQYLHHIFGEL